jgi:hypothetical protein
MLKVSKKLDKKTAKEMQEKLREHFDLPKKGTNVGNGPWAEIPETYSPGAIGWTDEYVNIIEDEDGVSYRLPMDEALDALEGTELKDGSVLSLVDHDVVQIISSEMTQDPKQNIPIESVGKFKAEVKKNI